MNIKTTHRRQFLRGAGGSVLAIPFLPSLASDAHAASEAGGRAFVGFMTDHGGLFPPTMYPLAATTQTRELLPGHIANFGPLVAKTEGTDTVFSSVLRAPATDLTPKLVSKMLVQRGLDVPFYLSHHWGGHLGNVAGNDGVAGGDQAASQKFPNPTLDHVMGWSSSFYPNLNGIVDRNVVFGYGRFSWGYSNPTAKSGTVEPAREQKSSRAVFLRILGGGTTTATPAPVSNRKPVVDKVLAHYNSLRQSNARLSASDRQRLSDYMDRITEVQRRLNVAPAASCGGLKAPTQDSAALGDTYRDAAKALQRISLINDVIAVSVMCGSTRAFVVPVYEIFNPYSGDWHQGVAHTHDQAKLTISNNGAFRGMLDLAKKLDVDAGDGGTYLDRSLLHWSQESGDTTHHGMNQAIVSFGSAGGYFKTGQFVDWQNRSAAKVNQYQVLKNPGLLINRWHANILLAMGIPKTDWPKVNNAGFGHLHMGSQYNAAYSAAHRSALGDPLPIITTKV